MPDVFSETRRTEKVKTHAVQHPVALATRDPTPQNSQRYASAQQLLNTKKHRISE